MSLKIGHVGSKSRSLGQILEKPCVRCSRHIFSPILLKFSKNFCPNDILDQFENVLCLKFSKNVCPSGILDQFENVLCWLKN